MRYRVVALPGRWAVAYAHVALGLVCVIECATRPAACAEAQRLESAYIASQKAAQMSLALHREHALNPRRSARYFEPDAFA